jgi:hypothetical protein
MENETAELDELQNAYKAAVEDWIVAIRREEALASVNHTVAQLDQWEQAHFDEEAARNKVLAAKRKYEDALRREFFNFQATPRNNRSIDSPSQHVVIPAKQPWGNEPGNRRKRRHCADGRGKSAGGRQWNRGLPRFARNDG